MAKKAKVKDGLVNSSDIKLKTKKVKPEPGKVGVDQLSPKVHNKDSLTENIQSRSSKSVEKQPLGKITKVPLSQKLRTPAKKKK